MESLKLLDQAIDSLDAIDSAAVRNEAEAQILNAFDGDTADLTEAETLATKYLRGAKRALALEILRAIDLDALRANGLGDITRDSAAARLEELRFDSEYFAGYLDECCSPIHHYQWICMATREQIAAHREETLRAAREALRYSVHRLEDDGTTWIDEASWVGDDLDEARRIAEMTGRGSQGSVIVDAIAQTVDFGDRVEKIGGVR